MILPSIIVIASFAGTASVFYLIATWLRPTDSALELRLAGLRSKAPARQEAARRSPFAALSTRFLPDSDAERDALRHRLIRAGIYRPGATALFILARVVCSLVLAAGVLATVSFGYADSVWAILFGCAMGAIGMALPGIWLDRQIRRRHATIRQSMSDFLDLSVICLDAGLSIQATIQRVSEELRDAHPILASELSIVLRDVELGSAVDAALKRFADRSGEETVRSLAALLRESQRFGTPLSDAMRTMSETLRLQREFSAEEAAQKAAVKILMPTLLLIFPAVFIVLAGPAAIQIQEAFAK